MTPVLVFRTFVPTSGRRLVETAWTPVRAGYVPLLDSRTVGVELGIVGPFGIITGGRA